MNYIEAVKELVNNPKAVAITFPSSSDPRGFRRIELETRRLTAGTYTNLVFPATENKRRQNVVATSPDFLLREDFTVVYKEERKYTAIEVGVAYHKGVEQGLKIFKQNQAGEAAFQEFKAAMKTIFGD